MQMRRQAGDFMSTPLSESWTFVSVCLNLTCGHELCSECQSLRIQAAVIFSAGRLGSAFKDVERWRSQTSRGTLGKHESTVFSRCVSCFSETPNHPQLEVRWCLFLPAAHQPFTRSASFTFSLLRTDWRFTAVPQPLTEHHQWIYIELKHIMWGGRNPTYYMQITRQMLATCFRMWVLSCRKGQWIRNRRHSLGIKDIRIHLCVQFLNWIFLWTKLELKLAQNPLRY